MPENWGLFGTDPHTNTQATWRTFVSLSNGLPRNGFTSGGSASEYGPQYLFSPLHNGVLFFRGVMQCPTNPSGTTFTTLPSECLPVNACRFPISAVGAQNDRQGGYCFVGENGDMTLQGISTAITTPTIDLTGMIHIGGTSPG
jgi:hypothetical protein